MDAKGSRLLLVGGGHSHLAVLADWIRHGLPSPHATILTPTTHLRYSGMVPGWIAGQYERAEGLVEVAALAKAAGAKLVLDRCVSVDPNARQILTQASGLIPFDIASFNTGGVGQAEDVLGADPRLLDVRPIDSFVEELSNRISSEDPKNTVIIGGGAGGVELAFGVRNREVGGKITLIEGKEGLLPSFSERARRLVKDELHAQDIETLTGDARITDGVLHAGEQPVETAELILAAIGSGAPDWPSASGLATDEIGFIAVDKYQRSLSHPHIFAVGDIAARQDRDVPHSGVHAVHAGPVLATNLRAAANGGIPDKTYTPRPASLYLLSTGNGSAIATYGPLAASGRWAGKLKHWIDKRWLATYAHLSREA